jgi:hypothetical protein
MVVPVELAVLAQREAVAREQVAFSLGGEQHMDRG